MIDLKLPGELKYTEDHEWIKVEDGKIYVGITDYAQEQLGDIVFVELPEENDDFSKDEVICEIESVKAVAEIYAPVTGTILEVNERLVDEPNTINSDPYEYGWLFAMEISDKSELEGLLSVEEYKKHIEEQEQEQEQEEGEE
ncbi:glycine cleavage system protein GcvH [Natranaerofaba carboxydovora]|uniref:glycine cleavage system protein GcvH n=1 Tax=Natranaerofaba carboxydovora TaxID=2742683 RepID=UPI001F13C648|nr:glycine cleavage system protein GcvH [Natranaerofaba carboxydovora]UMZ74301.1 Glycine cleavage system H protein [Natranaerofaba carboxydovora]